MKYSVVMPAIIQNSMSSIYVMMSEVLKDLRIILKQSNKNPIIIPFIIKIINVYAWLFIIFSPFSI